MCCSPQAPLQRSQGLYPWQYPWLIGKEVDSKIKVPILCSSSLCLQKRSWSCVLITGSWTKRQSQPDTPCHIQDLIDKLSGYRCFSILDQRKAYYQGFITEWSWHLTEFITPWGLYVWVRIPFGLSSALAAFQRSMEEMLNSLQDEYCIPYLDYALCFAKTFEDHVKVLRCVLRALQHHGSGQLNASSSRKRSFMKGGWSLPKEFKWTPRIWKPSRTWEAKPPVLLEKSVGYWDSSAIIGCTYKTSRGLASWCMSSCRRKTQPPWCLNTSKTRGTAVIQDPDIVDWRALEFLDQLIHILSNPPVLGYLYFNLFFVLHRCIRRRAWHSYMPMPGREAQSNRLQLQNTDTCRAKLQPILRQTWISGIKMGRKWEISRLSLLCTPFHCVYR